MMYCMWIVFQLVLQSARSKGYAFVEFDCDEVAKIAAETMDNYMMFGRLLKCKLVKQWCLHPFS